LATYEIFMPALSSTMTEGKIVEWLKKPGDRVERGEAVLIVESDKADMEVEAFQEGFLATVLMPAGGTTAVGDTIGLIVETQEESPEVAAKAPAAAAAPAPATTAAPAAAPSPTPAPVPVAAPGPEAAPVVAPPPAPVVAPQPVAAGQAGHGRVVATPRARKLAAQLGVALASVRGSGPNGRIQAEDVEQATGQPVSVPRVAEGTAPAMAAPAGNGAAAAWRRQQDACSNGTAPKAADAALVDPRPG
jgi:pyruvate dehydrogenase E2 component (dihydrolipoamide acetyltransferase)